MPKNTYDCASGDHYWPISPWGSARSIGYVEVAQCNNCLALKIHTKSDLGEVTQVITPTNNVAYPTSPKRTTRSMR